MANLTHILRGDTLALLDAGIEQELLPARLPRRVPAAQVSVEDTCEDRPAESGLPRRILRAAEARLSARPVEIHVFDVGPTVAPPEKPVAEPAPPVPEEAERVRRSLEEQWQQRLEDAVTEARRQGYDEGYEAAGKALQASYEERVATYSQDLDRLFVHWQTFTAAMEPLLVETAFRIAEAVLESPLPDEIRSASEYAIVEAIEQMGSGSPVDISLHHVDFLRLQESGLLEQLQARHPGINWDPTSSLKPGEWVVQSPTAAVRRLERDLLDTLRLRLGLLTDEEKEALP